MEVTKLGLANLHLGDCVDVMGIYPDSYVDLIITSPPYADQRKHTYGGIHPDKYVDWFLPRSEQMYRILKPTGSFVLNIKEKVVRGERSTYVLELIVALRKQGWLWTEEYIWHKRSSMPGKWPNRFRDSWERLLHFTKEKSFAMYQSEVMIPIGDWTKKRMVNMKGNDLVRYNSATKSGVGKNMSNWIGREKVYPTNVLHLASECSNQGHSAVYPKSIPSWFIKLFTSEGDFVLDPFVGSGTTCLVSNELKRQSIGIELSPEEYQRAVKRLQVKKEDYV